MQYLQQFHKISQIFKHAADNVENVIVFLINHTDIHIIQYLTDKKTYTVIPGYSFPENNTNDK